MYGQGIEKNVEEAIKFYYKAAEGWYGLAQYLLGKFYAAGQFVDKDDQQVDK